MNRYLNGYGRDTRPMTFGQYVGTFFIIGIPGVNVIMLLIWAFGNKTNLNKSRLCKAILLWSIILIVLGYFVGEMVLNTISNIFF